MKLRERPALRKMCSEGGEEQQGGEDTMPTGVGGAMFDVNSRAARRSLQHTPPSKGTEDMPRTVLRDSAAPDLRLRSASTGSSPAKMEACMFNFPLPAPRSWTIMVEPITKRTAGQPQLLHWRPSKSAASVDGGHDCRAVDLEEASAAMALSEDGSAVTGSSIEGSPPSKKRQRIYLNGTCIQGAHPAAPRRNPRVRPIKTVGADGKRVFTFVNDRRMLSPPLGSSGCNISGGSSNSNISINTNGSGGNHVTTNSNGNNISINDSGTPALYSLADSATTISAPESPDPSKVAPPKGRRLRKVNRKPLTFHQLEFNSETLKPFDRSVFVVNSGAAKTAGVGRSENCLPSKLLVEAAEILLELQSDADATVAILQKSPIESAANVSAAAIAN